MRANRIVQVVLTLALLAGCSGQPQDAVQAAEQQPASAVQAVAAAEPDLGMTPRQFSDRFNSKMKEFDLPYRINPNVNSGAVNDTFSAQLSNLIGFVGTASKANGNLSGAMIMAGGDGTPKSGLEAMIVGSAMFSAAIQDVPSQQIGPITTRLIKEAGEAKDSSASSILNGVRLSYSQSAIMGNVFTVEPVK